MDKVYLGTRPPSGPVEVLVRDGRAHVELAKRLDLWNHSPDGFEWGYCGSGPAQLSLAILADAIGLDNVAIHYHQPFKARVVAALARDRWTLRQSEVIAWVLERVAGEFLPPVHFGLSRRADDGA